VDSQTRRKWLKAIPIDIENLYQKIDEPLPHSAKHWWWCWGGIVGLLFVVQIMTGLLLAFYYRAGPEASYESIAFITEHARFGGFVRSVHHWGATFMVLFLFLHMLRVFVTAAYREYRWGAWMVGVGLLGLTLGAAFTGYALVSDQLSYWGMTVTSNIIAGVPIFGVALKRMFLAGDDINAATLSRMYALHVMIIPLAVAFLGVAHLFFVRLMGMHVPGAQKDLEVETAAARREGPYHFYPDHVLSELSVVLYLVLIIFMLAIIFPATLGPPSDPLTTPEHIKPEWYFYPFFHLLKLVPGPVGVTMMAILGLGLFFWPLLDQSIFQKADRVFKGRFETSILIGVVVLGFYLAWAVAEVG